jgi:DNA-binding IclR family transcriptional regulator
MQKRTRITKQKRPAKPMTDRVLSAVRRSARPTTNAEIAKRTGLDVGKVRMTVWNLIRAGAIRVKDRGQYVAGKAR